MVKKRKNIHIAIISKSDSSGGGASRVAEDLTKLLGTQENIIAHHWAGYYSKNTPQLKKLHGTGLFKFIYRIFLFGSRKIGLTDFITPEIFYHFWLKKLDYDIYHFHDISATFSPIALQWLAKRKPVVWTFHDCSPFTGGCLYPMGCETFLTRCDNCPQLKEWPLCTSIDLTGYIQKFKLSTIRYVNCIAPSEWMAHIAMKTGISAPLVIPNGVDTNLFKPYDKSTLREQLGLPKDKFIVTVSANSLSDPRKGTTYALQAVIKMRVPCYMVAIGKEPIDKQEIIMNGNIHYTGYIQEQAILAQYYAAADIFLFPTLADNLPLVVLENMACGTPVIAFATGGLPEIIEHGVNGWLAKQGNINGLIHGLEIAANFKEVLVTWGQNAQQTIKKKFNHITFLKSHIDLYHKILESNLYSTIKK
jgi:glycosyltransferase involved in cell wall biosynthesis